MLSLACVLTPGTEGEPHPGVVDRMEEAAMTVGKVTNLNDAVFSFFVSLSLSPSLPQVRGVPVLL